MATQNYYTRRNAQNIAKLREMCAELPDFCTEYFVGIEQRTTPLTRLNYGYDLRTFFHYLSVYKFNKIDPRNITLDMLELVSSTDIEAYLAYLGYFVDENGDEHSNSEKAKARQLATVRSLFKYFFNKDRLSRNVASKVAQPKLHQKPIIRLEDDETTRLLDVVESGDQLTKKQREAHKRNKVRDTAIVTTLLGTGIRVSELVGLNVASIDLTYNSLRITRKGGNEVILYFGEEVARALSAWLEERAARNVPQTEPALFLSAKNGRLTTRSVELLVKKYAAVAAPLKKISPHKLRSTYGTKLYHETQDIYVVAEVLGHRDVNTTKTHYAAMSDDIRRSVADKVVLHRADDPTENEP